MGQLLQLFLSDTYSYIFQLIYKQGHADSLKGRPGADQNTITYCQFSPPQPDDSLSSPRSQRLQGYVTHPTLRSAPGGGKLCLNSYYLTQASSCHSLHPANGMTYAHTNDYTWNNRILSIFKCTIFRLRNSFTNHFIYPSVTPSVHFPPSPSAACLKNSAVCEPFRNCFTMKPHYKPVA